MAANKLFDLFKSNATSTSSATNNDGSSNYPTSGQMRMENLAGEHPHSYIKPRPHYSHVRSYINSMKQILKQNSDKQVRFATGLRKEILNKLELQYDETTGQLLDGEALQFLHTKTKGISLFAIEMLHFGFNIELDKLLDLDRKTDDMILNKIRAEMGLEEKEPILTDEHFTWHFDQELFNKRFGETTDPFRKRNKTTGIHRRHKVQNGGEYSGNSDTGGDITGDANFKEAAKTRKSTT
ncbi:hypothetical protein GOP47_0012758 [Adiantum capillus-veneris]|uniref:Uncharacterized protein n=1 Tax=Adiantum capillus-veneris TaxID=13818 RepID=A0A9D4ZG03_ADICA|nr:hypothetical protein GOP47_0012758 [Adiantum capillus-veneris]